MSFSPCVIRPPVREAVRAAVRDPLIFAAYEQASIPSSNSLLWDDGTSVLWDDGTKILFE